MRVDYRAWLEAEKYGSGTIAAQLHRTGRVEAHYGDLEQHFRTDRLEEVISALRYSSEDERRGRPNPSKIPFEGKARTNLASYRNSVELYRRFLALDEPSSAQAISVSESSKDLVRQQSPIEDPGQRIGLERDMQAALRLAIDQLEPGITIVDDGAERFVESGRIDITAKDQTGAVVVIELKAGPAGQRAVAQVLSYMGDVMDEEPDTKVRGILIAESFDKKAIAAARMVPMLLLKTYGVKFIFSDAHL